MGLNRKEYQLCVQVLKALNEGTDVLLITSTESKVQ